MFRFRLESLMRLKVYKEKMQLDELGKCTIKLHQAEERKVQIAQEIARLNAEKKTQLKGIVSIDQIKICYEYSQYLNNLLVRQEQVIIERREELETARAKLIEAMKERKIFEKLKDKQYHKYLYEQDKLEQAALDELASRS